jgi:hypothetical protein
VCSGELDDVCNADLLLCCEVFQIATQALDADVLGVCTLVGEDQRAVASSVEAVMERSADSCACSVRALAIGKKLCCKSSGDLAPNRRASVGILVAASEEAADKAIDTAEDSCLAGMEGASC